MGILATKRLEKSDLTLQILHLIIVLILLQACSDIYSPESIELANGPVGDIDQYRLLEDKNPGDWLTLGRDYQQSYFSPLKLINRSTVPELGFAWQYELKNISGLQATPIVIDGIMFTSGPWGAAYALDAKTGKELWRFNPKIDVSQLGKACCGQVNRGVAVWHSMVYVASIDGYLYSLDAATGKQVWSVNTITERQRGYTITGAPYIAGDAVVIGNSGADLDARGYITAYELESGKMRWRFFTVPGDPANPVEHPELAMALKTWDPNSLWEVGLGGTAWDGMAYDPELNLLYVGTGNATPYPRKLRSPAGGDNLFLSSILAINPENGRLVWHYQTTPADNWDYTAAQKMVLAELEIDGDLRKVIMQAPKNGFYYVLDRETGALLSAEPFVPLNWAEKIDVTTGKPIETGQGEYFYEPKMIFPSPLGGHNWHPMAFNPQTGLVYIPAAEVAAIYMMPGTEFVYQPGARNRTTTVVMTVPGMTGFDGPLAEGLPPVEKLAAGQPNYSARGVLRAWDPKKQTAAWEVDTSGEWSGKLFAIGNGGGVMTTAGGLVFQGRGSGELFAYDAANGELLHKLETGTSIHAAPISYSIDGEQYIAVMAATGNYHPPEIGADLDNSIGRILSFKLGGGPVPKPVEKSIKEKKQAMRLMKLPMPPLPPNGSSEQYKIGSAIYIRNCSGCHNNSAPDLRRMNAETHKDFFKIVLEGSRAEKGMASFSHVLKYEEARALQSFLIDMAWQGYNKEQSEDKKIH